MGSLLRSAFSGVSGQRDAPCNHLDSPVPRTQVFQRSLVRTLMARVKSHGLARNSRCTQMCCREDTDVFCLGLPLHWLRGVSGKRADAASCLSVSAPHSGTHHRRLPVCCDPPRMFTETGKRGHCIVGCGSLSHRTENVPQHTSKTKHFKQSKYICESKGLQQIRLIVNF